MEYHVLDWELRISSQLECVSQLQRNFNKVEEKISSTHLINNLIIEREEIIITYYHIIDVILHRHARKGCPINKFFSTQNRKKKIHETVEKFEYFWNYEYSGDK